MIAWQSLVAAFFFIAFETLFWLLTAQFYQLQAWIPAIICFFISWILFAFFIEYAAQRFQEASQ